VAFSAPELTTRWLYAANVSAKKANFAGYHFVVSAKLSLKSALTFV
jgi:hypothetical protein